MKNLFERTRINGITLPNRLVRSATWERMASPDGSMTDRLFKVYEDLAKGGVGLIITGYAFVMKDEQPNPGMMGIYDDRFIEQYRSLTEMSHRHGSPIVLQIAYGGTQTKHRPEERTIWSPSGVPEMATGVAGREMTREDISTLVRAFGDAGRRAKEAGFDGVQIHGAHGYFLSQFLNPYHNRRTDEYGGPIENRSRIVMEVLEEIRRRVGEDFPVMIKINSRDYVENGATFEDCLYVCRELSRRGIDAIEISGGILAAGQKAYFARPGINTPEKEAYFAEDAARIAEEIDTPVILVGGLRSPEVMEKLLNETKIEYFALSRPFLTEPALVKRWESGDREKAECVSCNQCRTEEGNYCTVHQKKT